MEELRKEEYEGFDPPSWIWVSIQDGSRRSEEIEYLALSYCEKENVIRINKDFEGFRDLVDSKSVEFSLNSPYLDFFEILIRAVEKEISFHINTKMWTRPPSSDLDYYYIDRSNHELVRKIFCDVPCNEELTSLLMSELESTMDYFIGLR